MTNNKKIVLGWIDGGSVTSGFAAHVAGLLLSRGDIIENVVASTGPYLSSNRNTMVRTFLENTSADWLLSLDTDILIDLESFDALIDSLDAEKYQVLGGKYYVPLREGPELAAQVFNKNDSDIGVWISPDSPLLKQPIIDNLHSIGAGFMLVHRTVFETIAKNAANPMPWFQDYWKDYPANGWISDDIHFFTQVHKYNFNVALCTSATSIHLKTSKLDDNGYLTFHDYNKYQQESQYQAGKGKSWWVKGKKR
jgi:hypothetical protein